MLEYEWLCQYNGGERVVATTPGRLVVQNQAPGMLVNLVVARTDSVSMSRTADASLYCTYPKVKNLQSRSNTAKSSSFYATKVSIKGESSCQNSKTCAVQGRSLNHHHHHHSSFKSPLARPGWARFQEPKRPEPSFARRAQARKMKVSDRSDRSRMAGSTLPSELSSRQAEQGILEGPHEEDTRHPILHDTIIYLEILV